jgi:hypothetical protein
MLFYMYGCHISYIMYIYVAFGLWPTNKQTETINERDPQKQNDSNGNSLNIELTE